MPFHPLPSKEASMTAYATRAPLQLINNPHMMSEAHGRGRRTSKRLEDKEDAPLVNGVGHEHHENESVKGGRQGKGKNGASAKPATAKRKPSKWPRAWMRSREIERF